MTATRAAAAPQSHRGAGLFIAAFAGVFLFGCISSFWGMVVPSLEKSLGSVVNILLGNSVGLVVGSLFVGPVIDRLGKKMALSGGMLLVTVGVAGLGVVNTAGMAMAMAVLIGAGGSAIVTAANALVSDIARMRGTWLNLMNNAFAVGGALAAVIIPSMIAGGFQRVAWGLAVLAGLALAYYLALRFPPPLAAGGGPRTSAGALLGDPLLWAFAVMLFLYVGCEGTMWYWMNKYLTSEQYLGFEATRAGWIFFLFPIGIIVGRAISSWLLLRMDTLKLTLAASMAIVVTYTALLLVRDANAVRLFIFLSGVTMGPLFPTILAATGSAFSTATGTAMGLAITGGWLGYLFIPPNIGRLADLHTGLFLVSGAAVLLAVTNVVALRLAAGRVSGR